MKHFLLDKTVNQQFQFTEDGNFWVVRLSAGKSSLLVSVNINNTQIVSAIRAVSETPILFNSFLGRYGNIVFFCGDDTVPEVSKFNDSHMFYYVSPGEI